MSERSYKLNAGEIERRRIKLGISQYDLAIKAGVDPKTLRQWFKGKPAFIDNARKLAVALDAPIDEITILEGESSRLTEIKEVLPRNDLREPVIALPENNSFDWLMHLYDRINAFCNDWFMDFTIREGARCKSEEDVVLAVRMVMAGAGVHLSDLDDDLTDKEAIVLSEIVTSISTDNYFEKVLESWRSIPESIAFAVSDGRRVGSLRILPLTEDAYEAIKAGRLSIDHCDINNFVSPSNFLFLDAVGELSRKEYPFIERRTRQLVRMTLLMFAQLSYGIAIPLRILSFAGTPLFQKRVESLAFEPLGVRMPGSDLQVFELNMRKASLVPVLVREIQRRLFDGTAGPA